ncbi:MULTISPECIES: AAA family ATPase [Vitreoscilla]|uniref:AAA family ATPase n=1 Tax=Vitreoscilla stercoraria TaxID=61 RepID=A0ABY4EB57_VITST|nr:MULTISPECIES: AAA family ATPase [Vitreoscilla]AUZ03946.1 AAA domain-containing protein [Vitreoscilla sp. C1]UOO92130.1 AAA family ATPase [Vitreoscilla stercoraria]
MQLIIFTGIPAAGKSTFYQRYFYHSHLRINLDMLKTRHRESVIFEAAIASKTKIVIDNTNPSIEERSRYIPLAQAAGYEIVSYYFDTDLKSTLKRNEQRAGKAKIPVVGIKAKLRQLQLPTLAEGFQKLYRVKIVPNNAFAIELLESTDAFNPPA